MQPVYVLFPIVLVYCGNALQLYSYGCGQRIDAYCSAARLVVFKIFGVYLVVGMKVALHIYQEYGYIYKLIPAAATFFEDGAHVIEHAAALGCKIELFMVTMLIGHQAGNLIGTGLAGANTRKK